MSVDESLLGEFEFPVQHNPLNISREPCRLFYLSGVTAELGHLWPLWRRFWRYLIWRIPGYFLVLPKILTRVGLEMEWNRTAPY